ncbi:uncharacterized protein LOC111319566, partial [Stylophora pistillata]|uniref:uncharacterized protein LOC111319566 n=1 Tax=Stylophora pistillata TaxID=50429 RepID=UPI000C052269
DELNITIDVEDQKPAESNNQTTTSIVESEKYQMDELQKSSAAPEMQRSVSYPDTESLQALREKFFLLAGNNYLETTPPRSKEERDEFMDFMQDLRVLIKGARQGSLVITVQCKSLQILEELWREYLSGHLGEVVQICFVMETILKELNLGELTLKTTMDIEEYNACKVYFERIALRDVLSAQSCSTGTEDEAQIERWKQNTEVVESEKVKSSSPILEMSTTGHDKEGKEPQEAMKGALSYEFHSIISTSESLQKQEELKKWQQKTKVVETEKMKGTPPLTVISTTGKRKELKEPTGKKGTSLSAKLSTAGHGKELEGKLKTLKLQKEKRTWPVHEFSASEFSDSEKELAKLRWKLQAMEATMYQTMRSGLAKFDVSLPEELQSYVSYLLNESAKLGLRKR